MLKNKILIVNLKRREDRKNNIINLLNEHNISDYSFFDAVDGYNIPLNLEIKNLFKGNDFGNRCGVIGCALSHYNIWLNLINDSLNDYYIVLEDDITLDPDFNNKLNIVKKHVNNNINNIDLLFIGFHKTEEMNNHFNNCNQFGFIYFDKNLFCIGGTFGYIVTKTGAHNLINYIENNGIKHGIDYQMKLIDNSRLFMCRPSIVFSEWVQSDNPNVDSNIQSDTRSFDLNKIIDYNNFKFIKEYDQFNNDISFENPYDLDNVLNKCNELNDMSDGFNTFGFIKSHITDLNKVAIMENTDHGIYVKLDKTYRIKMLCNWCNSEVLCNEFNNMSKNNFTWNNIKIVSDDDFIDYYVIINYPHPSSYFVPDKTLIFHMEPSIGTKNWNEWSNPDPNTFLHVGIHENSINNCAWQVNYSYNYLMNNNLPKIFNKCLSTLCSDKYFDIGHIRRIDFLKFLESKTDKDFELHVYGNVNKLHTFQYNMGTLDMKYKQNGISPYKYYFIFENNFEHNYISEKLWEPIICETLCFYIGAPNVTDYINKDAFVLLDINDFEKSYQLIQTAITEDWWSKRINIIREEKYKILNYYNFFPTIERIITKNIWKDNIDDLIKNTSIFILTQDRTKLYKSNVFKKTMEYFNFNVSEGIYTNNHINSIVLHFIDSYNIFKFIYESKDIFRDNILIYDINYKLIGSLNNLFNHLLYLPDNYDVCQLHEDQSFKWKYTDQINPFYYKVKQFPFICNGPFIISKNYIKNIINFMENIINNKNILIYYPEKIFYEIYQKNDFNFFVSKNIFQKD